MPNHGLKNLQAQNRIACSRNEISWTYNSADVASNEQQVTFLLLIRAEYVILFSASVLSLDLWPSKAYFGVYAAVFLCSMGILIFRSVTKPEQVWYQARALAESVKTLTWRFAMRVLNSRTLTIWTI
ncbi:DUF4231 domain-containing protein [Mesorhizobium sp.]|uniref:DUF4231 domain-containing protein n=1 Tax=Mesorhizobium sp. TaxID=1871066 RepID=UPI00338F63E0